MCYLKRFWDDAIDFKQFISTQEHMEFLLLFSILLWIDV